jgi:hypothetical protein
MPSFPQLRSGSSCQYPFSKTLSRGIVRNQLGGGSVIQAADPDVFVVRWDLSFRGIDATERAAIEGLHEECGGASRPFVFLDPLSNLLSYSGSLKATVWQREGQLLVEAGEGPDGQDGFLIVNSGAAPARIFQSVRAPGNRQYCLSAWISASSGNAAALFCESGERSTTTIRIGGDLTRYWATAYPGGSTSEIRTGFEIGPGVQVFLSRPQLDSQPAPGPYRASRGAGGVHSQAYFADQPLRFTETGEGTFSCRLQVIALVRE